MVGRHPFYSRLFVAVFGVIVLAQLVADLVVRALASS